MAGLDQNAIAQKAHESNAAEEAQVLNELASEELRLDDLDQAAGGYDFENHRHMSNRERER